MGRERGASRVLQGITFISILVFSGVTPAWAQARRQGISGIAEKAAGAIVLIKGSGIQGQSFGTGFLISSDGKIVTALHVVSGLTTATVKVAAGDTYDRISVLAYDERKDIAIIKIPGFDLPHLELGNSNQVAPGDKAIVIGNPEGLQGSITAGIISAIRESPEGGDFKVIQTDASVNPGNSGGPLLNFKGQVIGVVDSKIRGAENLNFAIPINYIRGLLQSTDPPIPLAALVAKLGKALPGKERGFVDAQGVITELSYPQLKSLVQNAGYTVVSEDPDKYTLTIELNSLKVFISSSGQMFLVTLLLQDKIPLEPINQWNIENWYVVALRFNNGNTGLMMPLWLGNGVTKSTVASYIQTFAQAIPRFTEVVLKAEGKR